MDRVKDKVVIVTGGASGIGRAACSMFAREGAMVALVDILNDEGEEAETQITNAGGFSRYWHLDVSDEKRVMNVFGEIRKHFGKINILVNNAAIVGAAKATHEMTEEEWDEVIAVNMKGAFFCTKHVIPYLKEAGGGSIINISSVYGIIGAPDVTQYHATKGAIRLMTKTDALLYAKDKIRVNSICPGFIMTPMTDRYLRSQDNYDQALESVEKLHPLGHLGEPDDIAYGILYLASDESKFVTGTDLIIDGGYTAQ